MFSVNSLKQLKQIANSISEGFHQFSEDDQVWRGDDGSYVIGDAEDFDADDADLYVAAGTLAEYRNA